MKTLYIYFFSQKKHFNSCINTAEKLNVEVKKQMKKFLHTDLLDLYVAQRGHQGKQFILKETLISKTLQSQYKNFMFVY